MEKMKKLILLLLVCLPAVNVIAQDSKSPLAVSVGAAVDYYYGRGNQNFGKFNDERVNWHLNAMLGLVLARSENNRRTMIAGFGAFGFNNGHTVDQIFNDQDYITVATQDQVINFYQAEGGLLIADVLRISTGVGQQNFKSQPLASINNGVSLNANSLKYNSTTVGLNLTAGLVALTINCNFNYGKDYTKTVINPSAGIMLNF